MAFAMSSQGDDNNFISFDLESERIQMWWDTIQSRNRYFFELIEIKLFYIEKSDLYLLLLEMDDCLDDLDTIDCPTPAYHLRESLERSVQDMTLGLIYLDIDDDQQAQLYFNTSKALYSQTVRDYFELLPF